MVYTWAPPQNGLRVPNYLKWQFLQPDNYVQNSIFKNKCTQQLKFSKVSEELGNYKQTSLRQTDKSAI